MMNWKNAWPGDLKRISAIETLLRRQPHFISFLFNPEHARLKASPATLRRKAARIFSGGEAIMIRVAMDIWNDSGKVQLAELDRLDEGNFQSVLTALQSLRRSVTCFESTPSTEALANGGDIHG